MLDLSDNKLKISVPEEEYEYPISNFKLENCYSPSGKEYPLCKGQKGNKDCLECNVYEY